VHVEQTSAAASEPPAAPRPLRRLASADPRHRAKWLLAIGLEVLLISASVFLALMGEQWRERARARELAEGSLRRLRAEIVTNRRSVEAVKDYHVKVYESLERYFAAPPAARKSLDVTIRGVQPVFFEHTAWDLAVATEALAHIDQNVAFALSRIYGLQDTYGDLTGRLMQALYLHPTMTDSFPAFRTYYGDIVLWEPRLLEMYDNVLPQIDRALGESPTRP
jgi:hypothetical protein